ncbi:GatB/YqeY domain-containing protein [Legionella fairfieldensis]|uniref:GatB/YqeY domain-containing protein n=1 Tax=Legionella fairfieldensis TaxID=45064 RepID=UPI00048A9200|nr:GatB/YqeY domain-containing protein [Legionella fairfieldensis]
MAIKDRISNDLKDAMRARDKKKLDTLRLITAAVKQVEVDERIVVDEERMLVILDKLAKQRKESIAQFQAAGREDLVAQEQFELELISNYLPEPLTKAEIEALIVKALADTAATKISDMGKVMTLLKPQLQGRADMGEISMIIKAKLS